jgi:hypothetical protein
VRKPNLDVTGRAIVGENAPGKFDASAIGNPEIPLLDLCMDAAQVCVPGGHDDLYIDGECPLPKLYDRVDGTLEVARTIVRSGKDAVTEIDHHGYGPAGNLERLQQNIPDAIDHFDSKRGS